MRMRFGPFELDDELFELRREGQPVPLQPRVFDLLVFLVKKRDVVVTRAALLEGVWAGVAVTKDALAQAVMALRRGLGDDGETPRYIDTVRGRGYRFIAPVSTSEAAAAVPPAARAQGGFVGRAAKLEQVLDARARAGVGVGGVVLIAGDAGVGKTRFADELATRLGPVLLVRCGGAPDAPPLWLLTELLRALRQRRVPMEGQLADVVDGRVTPETLASPQARFAFADRLLEALASATSGGSALIVADDLHLADAPTLATLEVLVPRLRAVPVTLCAVYAPTPLVAEGPFGSFVGAVAREPSASQARLEPFTREETALYLEATLGSPPAAPLAGAIHEKTRGNAQLLAALTRDPGEWARRTEVQTAALLELDTLREALFGHLKSLPEGAIKALSVAAVFGGARLEVGPLSVVLDAPVAEVVAALDAGCSARVLARVAPGSYRFLYPLVRDVLLQRLPPLDRAALHGRVADALEAQSPGSGDHRRLGEIASHRVEACATGDSARAVASSLRAAELAAAEGDGAAASRYATRGLAAVAFAATPDPKAVARLRALAAMGS